uniref:Putative endoplasmic reticulum-based factor for assembly of v-atpase n=1 Tax=Anopheles braziliensis TaxID=58242 RepID=A0A2M3ZJD4_9DIPT
MASPMAIIPYHSTIYVIPSKRLCNVIGGTILPDSPNMPAGICKLYAACTYDGLPAKHPTAGRAECWAYRRKYDVQFTDEECRSINRYLNDQSQRQDRETAGFFNPPYGLGRTEANQANASQIRLDLNDLKWLYDTLARMRGNDASVPYLHSLLADCSIAVPERLPAQDHSFVWSEEKRGHRLGKEARKESVKHQQMTSSRIDCAGKPMPADAIGFPLKHLLNRHLLAVVQFVCSVGAGFAFGFIGVEFLVGPLDFGFRLLLGVMIGLIVALTEIYFLAQKLNEDDDDDPSAGHTLQSMTAKPTKTHQD